MNSLKTIKLALISLFLGISLSFAMVTVYASTGGSHSSTSSDADQTLTCDEYAWHEHGYENTTRRTGYESYAQIRILRIYLHDDFMENVNLNDLWCSSPNGWLTNCADGVEDDGYGGMTVELVQNDRSSDAEYPNYLEWTYGIDDSSEAPIIAGKNDEDGDGDVDTTEDDRDMAERVNFVFNDVNNETLTATTTAGVWIKFIEYDQDCGNPDADRCWEAVEEDEVSGTTDFHWNTETNPYTSEYYCPSGESACTDLVLSPEQSEISVNDLFEDKNLTVEAYSGSTNITDEVEFHYEADTTEGYFGDGNPFDGGEGTDFTTEDNTISYNNIQVGDSITVEVVGAEGACLATLNFPYCRELSIDEPSSGDVATGDVYSTDIEITATASTGEPWPFEFLYSSTDLNATFDGDRTPFQTLEKVVAYLSENSARVTVQAIDDASCVDSFDYTLIPGGDTYCEDLNLGEPYTNSAGDTCYDYNIDVLNADFTGTLVAEGTNTGDLTLNVNQTGRSVVGNPARTSLDAGTVRYSGSLCFEATELNTSVNLYVEGETACLDSASINEVPDETVCLDLELEPDSVTIQATEVNTGTVNLTINVSGSTADFVGTLVIEETGAGSLFYANNSASEFSDGHLEMPVSGISNTLYAIYKGGKENDSVRAYIKSDIADCSDAFTVTAATIPPEEKLCRDLNLTLEDNKAQVYIDSSLENQTLVVDYTCPDGSTGSFEEEDIDGSATLELDFDQVCEVTKVSAYIKWQNCRDDASVEVGEIGTLEKYIFTFNFSYEKDAYSDQDIFFSHNDDFSYWTLEYDPLGTEDEVEFTDTLWGGGYIEGKLADGTNSGGSITLAHPGDGGDAQKWNDYDEIQSLGLTEIREVGSGARGAEAMAENLYWMPYIKNPTTNATARIPACEENSVGTCYDPNTSPDTGSVIIKNIDQVTEGNVIRIRYVGLVNSNLNCDNQDDECLTETFKNTGTANTTGATVTEEANLVVICAYLVTRNAGDVYLEEGLASGTDIACIYTDDEEADDYANIEGIVVLDPDSEEALASALSVCSDTDSGDVISNLSSYVCELINTISEFWKRQTVEMTTNAHIAQEIRNAETNQMSKYNQNYSGWSWDDLYNELHNKNNPNSHILYYQGNPNDATDKVYMGGITVPSGAWTIIVTDADLVITGNIRYANVSSFEEIPSVAYIVLGGDIYIQYYVHDMYGVYYTDQNFTGDERSAVDQQLEIYGSIYGNIEELQKAANYVGPPTLDGGGIVIRYDSRILLNTPPGLSNYVDINSEKAVN